MAYSRKFAGLFGTLGYKTITDCKTQTVDEIVNVILAAFGRRAILKQEVDESRVRANKKLDIYEQVLRDLIAPIKARRS